MSVTIAVYADWVGLGGPVRLGWLYARSGAGRDRLRHNAYCMVLDGQSYRAPKTSPGASSGKHRLASDGKPGHP